MKIWHIEYETDEEAYKEQPTVDDIPGVLKAEQHPAFGNGPAYLVVITQGDFDPAVFQRESSLAYEDKDLVTQPEPEPQPAPEPKEEVGYPEFVPPED